MMFILDTHVISELRKAKAGKAHPGVVRWAERAEPEHLFVSVITLLELEGGVLLKERSDPTQGAMLRSWLDDQVLPAFHGRVLNIDAAIARRCARLHVPDPRADRDAMIAATALVHDMSVVTRNVSDFGPTGVRLVNPWVD